MSETKNSTKNNTLRGVVCTLLGGCFWGFSGNFGQYLFHHHGVDPQWLTLVRMLCAGLISVVIILWRQRAQLMACLRDKRDRVILFCHGVFGLMLCQYTFMETINATNAGTATVLQYTGPVLIMVLVCLRERRLPRVNEAVSIVLVVLGTFLIATHGDIHTMKISKVGLLWGLSSAVTLVLYTLLPKSLAPKYGSFTVTGAAMLIGGIAFYLLVRPESLLIELPPSGWLAVAGMVVLGTLLSFPLYLQGVSDIGPVKASMLASVEPLSATVVSVLWLNSAFSVWDGLGFVCIIGTVFLLAKQPREEKQEI